MRTKPECLGSAGGSLTVTITPVTMKPLLEKTTGSLSNVLISEQTVDGPIHRRREPRTPMLHEDLFCRLERDDRQAPLPGCSILLCLSPTSLDVSSESL